MRRWYVSLTVLGLGSLGLFLLSEWGREALGKLFQQFQEAPERLAEWNDSIENELDRIQTALNRIAETLEPRPELGR